MLRKSLLLETIPMSILPWDRQKCRWISYTVILQCIVIYIGAITVLDCHWSPDKAVFDFDKLTRIMYLYDHEACGYRLKKSDALAIIRLSNETYGLPVLPIKWAQAQITVSTRLSSKTRVYVESSLGLHTIWMIIAIGMNIIMRNSRNLQLLKITLFLFFYMSICIIIFDMSMAFVYVVHIQQCITKGMVIRYSGWSVEISLQNYDEFAGWIPIAASVLWVKLIFVLAWNIYCCKFINSIQLKIKKREVKTRLIADGYRPIPDPSLYHPGDKSVLYYRRGEHKPSVKDEHFSKIFFN